ncbi:MAG: type II toxin-antitoxin system HicB family antitoxin [Candidatus Zixiibacteriota bacterium]
MEKVPIKYNLVIQASDDPLFYRFTSPELDGFKGTGISVDDCIQKACLLMEKHIVSAESIGRDLPSPPKKARITIVNDK